MFIPASGVIQCVKVGYIKLRLCQTCDKLSMEMLGRLMSYATGIETISKCILCGGANSKLTIHMSLPFPR